MKNVSLKAKQYIYNNLPIYAYARVVLNDGTELFLTSERDFFISGNSFTQSGGDGFPLGKAICKTINISIDNHDDRFSNYDFYKAKITLYTEIPLTPTPERIQEGIFTVIDSVAPGDIIEFSAYDNMYKADKAFESGLIYPNTCQLLLNEICSICDIPYNLGVFQNSNFVIKNKPTGYTARELIGSIAEIAGGNALITPTGVLQIKSYDLSAYSDIGVISGGRVPDNLNDIISGGELGDSTTDSVTAERITENSDYIILHQFSADPQIGTDDITITGIVAEVDEDGETVKYIDGTEDYALYIDNPLIEGNESAAVHLIGDVIIGFTVRPFSGSFAPNCLLEFMDTVFVIDRKYNIYQSIVSEHSYNYLGASEVENATQSPERNTAAYSNNSGAMYRRAVAIADKNRTDWETAVENLTDALENAPGLYETTEGDPPVYYFHDKENLSESEVVIKITSQALGISTDGGQTYPTGITVDGNAVINILSSVGVNANWIQAGTLTLGGSGNDVCTLSILDSNNQQIGAWDSNGIQVLQGSFKTKDGNFTTEVKQGKIFLSYNNNLIGTIGTNKLANSNDYGLVYDLESVGAYMGWAAAAPGQSQYDLKLFYVNQGFDVFTAGNMYLGCDLDLAGNDLKNGGISNVGISNISSINGYTPYTGSYTVVTDVTIDSATLNPDGQTVNVQYHMDTKTITVQDGLIVSVT